MPRPTSQRRERWLFEAAAGSALFVLISAWAGFTQQAERIFGDAQTYHRMAQQFGEGQVPVAADAPFVYRPATPWLASVANPLLARVLPRSIDFAIEDASGLKGVPGFYLVNIGATFGTMLLLLVWMRAFVPALPLRLMAVTLWLIAWYAPARFTYFYPVNAEPFFLLNVAAALLVIERVRHVSSHQAAVAVTPIIFIGTLARESMLAVLAAFLVSRLAGQRPKAVLPTTAKGGRPLLQQRAAKASGMASPLLPIAAFAAAVMVTRTVAAPTNSYDALREAARLAGEKPLYTWVLAWCFAFGPATLAVVLSARRDVWSFLRAHPHLGLYLALVALLAFVGGTDTERILGWAAPVVFLLLAIAVDRQRDVLRRCWLLTGVLLIVQLASARLFWPIPVGVDTPRTFASLRMDWPSVLALADKALVIDNYYANLWSFFGSRAVHAWVLAADLVFIAFVVWRLGRASRAAVTDPRRIVGNRRAH